MEKLKGSDGFKPILLNKPKEETIKKAQGVMNINSDILQASFITLIVGKPGCGKSHLIHEFILNKDLYYKKFSLVLFITPSKFEDPDLVLDEFNYRPTVEIQWIHGRLRSFKDCIEKNNPEGDYKEKNILIIFDDVVSELKKNEKDADFMALFYNRRHLLGDKFLISYLITTQKYVMCPSKIRSVLTAVIAFPLMSMDWKKVEEECIYDSFDKRWTAKFMRDVKEKKFSFIYIRLDNSKIFYKFEKCLNL